MKFSSLTLIAALLILFSCHQLKKGTKDFDPKEKQALTAFLTQFAEINIPYFAENAVPDSVLLHFGVYHTWMINPDSFDKCDSSTKACIDEKAIADSADLYFGKKPMKQGSFGDCIFENGKYKVLLGDGEAYSFAQASELVSDSNDVITFKATEYIASSGWTGDINGNPESWKAADKDSVGIPEVKSMIMAKVKRIKGKEKSTYQILQYKKL